MAKRPYKGMSLEERLLRDVSIDAQTGCWLWLGPQTGDGYGKFNMTGMPERAHRASYLIFKGELILGLCICHTCDTPLCINPEHLWQGTFAENSEDRDNKQRGGFGRNGGKLPEKLSWQQVCNIRASDKSGAQLARELNVSGGLISAIRNYRARIAPPKQHLFKGEEND